MTGMPALSLHQPWASLCVTRRQVCSEYDCPSCISGKHERFVAIKQFETRSWPCPPNLLGQRIALHATQATPKPWSGGDWYTAQDGLGLSLRRFEESTVVRLPLGAIVGSAVIEACYPIVDRWGGADYALKQFVTVEPGGTLLVVRHGMTPVWTDISDQLPYAEFTPGRYAWLLTDAAPVQERCPWCDGHGFVDGRSYPTDYGTGIEYDSDPCPVCSDGIETGPGRCEPIPTRGRQRIWEWDPTKVTT